MKHNNLVDPTYFDDAIDEFKFPYVWYAEKEIVTDELGRRVSDFSKETIYGSLQPDASSLHQNKDGNYQSLKYRFYCNAKYRIGINDFLQDEDGNFIHIDGCQNYDPYGVRICYGTMVTLNQYKNLQDYIKYLNGDKIL